MINKNIQMKKREGDDWDNLFPVTLTENVYDKIGNSVDSEIERLDQKDEDLIKQLTETNTNIEVIKHKQSQYVSVTDFGAVGDGVTDDTVAIQSAINSINKQRQTIIFPPTNGGFYKVSELTIPKSAEVSTLTGIGDARIYFTGDVGFHILAEFIQFSNLTFHNIKGQNEGTNGTILFKDERSYSRLDFDLHVKIALEDTCNNELLRQTYNLNQMNKSL